MLATLLCVVSAAVPAAPARLSLKSVVLYENGVGYFERTGRVASGQVAEIPLEAGQLDDALKSMVVLGSRGVASVEYAPPLAAEAARAEAGLPEPGEERSMVTLLTALTGVEVKVTSQGGAPVRGRVVEVTAEVRHTEKGQAIPEPTLVVFGEAGLSRLPVRLVSSVQPVEPSVTRAWTRAAGAESLRPDRQSLKLRGAAGTGEVRVGYTTEAAVWRTTYRLVAGKGRSRLQGFALVHNDSDEAWEGVTVTLASGRPTSFLFPLAGPRYGRRELVSPQDGLDAAPQLATREAREHLLGGAESGGGSFGLGGLGTVGHGSGGGGMGYGSIGVGSRGTIGASTGDFDDGPAPLDPAAVSEAGDLFLYQVKEPVFLGPRKSALLPIIDQAVTGERVSVLGPDGEVYSGVRLTNSTPLTLEGGTLAVFTDGAYAGETQIDRVKPKEVRVVRHGLDLDLEATRSSRHDPGGARKARLTGAPGARVLEVTRVDRTTHALTLTSRTDSKRAVLVDLGSGRARLVSGAAEDVRSPGQPRFARLEVAPHAERSVDVVEETAVVQRYDAGSLSSNVLAGLLSDAKTDQVRMLLTALKVDVVRAEVSAARAQKLGLRLAELDRDALRLREGLAAAGKGGAGSAARELGNRLLLVEDELKKARDEQRTLTEQAQEIRRTLLARL